MFSYLCNKTYDRCKKKSLITWTDLFFSAINLKMLSLRLSDRLKQFSSSWTYNLGAGVTHI